MSKVIKREYPSQPIVGIGAVIVKEGKVLLIKRGKSPSLGEWSIPGGAVNVGEPLEEALLREIKEETGLVVNIRKPIEILDKICRDEKNKVKYHYILLDYAGDYVKGKLKPSSDVLDARFISPEKLDSFGVNGSTKKVIEKALENLRRKDERIATETEIISTWDLKKAKWYHRAIKESDFSGKAMEVLLPIISGCKSIIDIGAGCGALSIPLAENIKHVTALEPSKPMMNIMKREAFAKRLKNINFVNAHWEKVKLPPHEAVILANVPGILLNDIGKFLNQLEKIKPRLIILIQGVDPKNDKFYFRQLYPIIFGKTVSEKYDYLKVYSYLHSHNIYANVRIIKYNLDQPFNDLKEALRFWKVYLGLKSKKYDGVIRGFLSRKLVESENNLIARIPKKSAIIWWNKEESIN